MRECLLRSLLFLVRMVERSKNRQLAGWLLDLSLDYEPDDPVAVLEKKIQDLQADHVFVGGVEVEADDELDDMSPEDWDRLDAFEREMR